MDMNTLLADIQAHVEKTFEIDQKTRKLYAVDKKRIQALAERFGAIYRNDPNVEGLVELHVLVFKDGSTEFLTASEHTALSRAQLDIAYGCSEDGSGMDDE